MALECKTLAELQRAIESAVDSAISREDGWTVGLIRSTEALKADENVYSPKVYTPKRYHRRYSLMAPENMPVTMAGGILTVTNNAQFNDDPETKNVGEGLVYLVEGGHGTNGYKYEYPQPKSRGSDGETYKKYPYFFPRPFIKATREYLADNMAELVDHIAQDLYDYGFDEIDFT